MWIREPLNPKDEMSGEDLEQWLNDVCQRDWTAALDAIADQCLVSEAILTQMLHIIGRDAPLPDLRPQAEVPDQSDRSAGRLIADEDWEPLVRQAAEILRADGFRLHYALRRVVELYRLTPRRLAEFLDRNQLFREDGEGLVAGVHAWMDEDHANAFYILVPQIERGVREWIRRIGINTAEMQRIGIAELIGDDGFAQIVGRDVRLHLLAIYSDPSGWNLRDCFVRGRMQPEELNEGVTNWLLHTLLVLARAEVQSPLRKEESDRAL